MYDLKVHGVTVDPVTDPLSIGSNFGRKPRGSRELIGYRFVLANPRARLLYNEGRNFNLLFALGQFIWNLSGSNEIESISYYNGRGADFSDDGKTVYGSSYWKRLVNPLEGDQMRAITNKIRQDPSTRRSFAAVFHPIDNLVMTRDVPCPIGVQYLLRDKKLFGITYMRSNSAPFVMPYNVFFFTMLQELLAKELDAQLGSYVHICSSLHYYADEESFVDKVLAAKIPRRLPMKPMPDCTNLQYIKRIVAFEETLRTEANSRIDLDYWLYKAGEFDPYWTQIAYLLIFYALSKNGQVDELGKILELLQEEYRFFAAKFLRSQLNHLPSTFHASMTQ